MLRSSIKVFDDGLKESWSPSKRKILWEYYIDHIIDIWKEYNDCILIIEPIYTLVNETMEQVFQKAQNAGALHKPDHFAYWVIIMNHNISFYNNTNVLFC